MTGMDAEWTVTPEPPDSPAAKALWRAYYTEVSDRWFVLHEGRDTPQDELARGIADDDGLTLAPPSGVLFVGRWRGEPGGCAGVRLCGPGTAELKRMFVVPGLRGRGGGGALLAAAESAARSLGAGRLVLDTRHDLVEARALYARHGFTETAPHNAEPYSDRWLGKELPQAGR
ncbi:GNAT family N-acetyltransferase [Streptomyces sp. NPDC050560]|uniref:GNAT family N-acetyltransferase n=1 Tax=Streptomyces sp. NPDC050560 TaxID=3365630 RepID=UPI003790C9C8